jgi:hypothetical protein
MENLKKIQEIYRQTEIWKHFSTISSTEKQSVVGNLVDDASSILDRIIETFPTYTLHNGQHQLNILNLYEKLLGQEIKSLTDLESAILILSAFYHDIGMVFNDSERSNLKDEEYFSEFLVENIRAKLAISEDNGISTETAEWFCRWSHAKRVWKYLDPINDKLLWEGNNIRKELAKVCLSHNEKTDYIKSESLSSSFWNNSDFKFCAILLRLADVLDFDDTRTPESTYYFLGLDEPKNRKEKNSQVEWKKHFASKGFSFENWSNENNYTILFQAAPKEPTIEHDIHSFLNYIENEFKECSSILQFCSERWKHFKLPEKIDRKNIISQGYTFGDFKFSLDQTQVLSLLMGESLYNDQYVFIRELLQNAIDTSRHRKFYEINRGNISFESKQIDVSTWHDSDGYRWIRIDDCGMGMTFSQISKFFLKVGNSYYNSDEFKVEKLSYKKNSYDFVPVSRFGIGVLSCFIVGDIVEVSTKSIFSDNKKIYPIRLSLKGIHNYYILQTADDIPSEMPAYNHGENKYRSEFGTSLAIRLKPNNDLPDFDLSKILNTFLFNPEVPVNLFNKGKKGRYLLGLDKKSTDIIEYKLNNSEQDLLYSVIKGSDIVKINPIVKIIPINLNGKFSHPNINGFLYLFMLCQNIERQNKFENSKNLHNLWHGNRYINTQMDEITLNLSYWNHNSKKSPELSIDIKDPKKNNDYLNSDTIDLTHLLKPIEIFNGDSEIGGAFYSIVLSHNGVIVPNNNFRGFNIRIGNTNEYQTIGYIELSDKLRPNLSVARNDIISIPWSIWSSLNYTIRSNFPEGFDELKRINFINFTTVTFSNLELNEDELLMEKKYWPSEKIFLNNTQSIIEILQSKDNKEIDLFSRSNETESILRKKIIELYSTYKITLYKQLFYNKKYELVKKATIKESYLSLVKFDYPPLCFCEYENFNGLMPQGHNQQILNINHPFSIWLIKIFSFLVTNFSNYLYILLNNTDIAIINSTINKLRLLLPDTHKPSVDLFLTEDDFTVDIDRLPVAPNGAEL